MYEELGEFTGKHLFNLLVDGVYIGRFNICKVSVLCSQFYVSRNQCLKDFKANTPN